MQKKKRGRPPRKVFQEVPLIPNEEEKEQKDGFFVESKVGYNPYTREVTYNGFNRQRIVDYCYPSKYLCIRLLI